MPVIFFLTKEIKTRFSKKTLSMTVPKSVRPAFFGSRIYRTALVRNMASMIVKIEYV